MNTILLTGFEPWKSLPYNSSWESVRDAQLILPDGWCCNTALLPVSWANAAPKLESLITQDVKAVICFGMAVNKSSITPECIAFNMVNMALADAAGFKYEVEHISLDGPDQYQTKLPISGIISSLQHNNIPCEESRFGGLYLCNFTFYRLMHFIALQRPDIVGGFVHVPAFDENNGLKREVLASAISIIADAVIRSVGNIAES